MTLLRDLFSLIIGRVPSRGGLRLSSVGWVARLRIRRALSSGTALERPEEARIAVAVARRHRAARDQAPRLAHVVLIVLGLGIVAFGVAVLVQADVRRGCVVVAFGTFAIVQGLRMERARAQLARAEARNLQVATGAGWSVDASHELVEPSGVTLSLAAVLGDAVYAGVYWLMAILLLGDEDSAFVADRLAPGLTFGAVYAGSMLTVGLSRSRRAWAETSRLERR